MQYGGKILIGLLLFVVLLGYPIWINFGRSAYVKPELAMPKNGAKQCIESKEWMLKEHMKLLDEWRHQAVRSGETIYISHEGKAFTIGLQTTCMNCHDDKSTFCDRCHNSLAVSPFCWDCHIPPKQEKQS